MNNQSLSKSQDNSVNENSSILEPQPELENQTIQGVDSTGFLGVGMDEDVLCNDYTKLTQLKISDLINNLNKLKEKHGDLGVLFWDQECACKFKEFSDFCDIDKQYQQAVLLFGGFHVNGCDFRKIS